MSRRGCRGFTLIEMAVALAVVAVALFLAAGLLREAHVLAASNAGQLLDPLAGRVAARLRADVQAAAGVAGPPGPAPIPFWTEGPLCLAAPGGAGLLCWHRAEGELRRQALDEGGPGPDAVWLSRVVAWRWRQIAPGLVEVELGFTRAAEPWRWRLAGPPHPPSPGVSIERLRLALRGGGRASGW